MWEYLIHSTRSYNINKIIKDGYLIPNEPGYSYNVSGVYMSLLYDTLKYKDKYWEYNSFYRTINDIVFGFDTHILKNHKFRICPSMSGGCIDDIILSGNGNLSKKPNLTKLKNHINKI